MKRLIKPVMLGIFFAFILLTVKSIFKIDDDVFKTLSFSFFGIILAGALAFNILWTAPARKKLLALMKEAEEGNGQNAVNELEIMVKDAEDKGKARTASFYKVNLAAAYIETREFQKATDTIDSIDKKYLKGDLKLVTELNKVQACFMNGDKGAAVKYFEENEKLFKESEKRKNYAANIAIVTCLYLVAKGNTEEAEKYLKEKESYFSSPRFKKSYLEIEEILSR